MEIKSELFSLVVIELKYTRKIYSIKNLATCFPIEIKKFINSNNSEENEDEANEPVDIEFTEHKTGPDNHENAIDFRKLNVQEEARKILL